ncbi:unnamed protein product, partial [Brassica rapa]
LKKLVGVLQTLYNFKTNLQLIIHSLSSASPTEANTKITSRGKNRIVWKCKMTDLKNYCAVILWRAYRGAAMTRCGQIREFIADLKGVSLVKNKKPTKEFFSLG